MHTRAPEPFFSIPPSGAEPRRRLLLLSYHFPPARTAGALRWQKMASFAAERGWGLDVVARNPAELLSVEWAGLADLPPSTRVFGVDGRSLPLDQLEHALWKRLTSTRNRTGSQTGTPSGAHRILRPESLSRAEMLSGIRTRRDLIRAYHAWRSLAQETAWAKDAGALVRRVAEPERHRAVITCGPPHSVHHEGRHLTRRLGLPLVVDMRDPWSLVERLPESIASPVWLRVNARRERATVTAARMVVANTELAAEALRRVYPWAAERVVSVMNGYDDQAPSESRPGSRGAGRFTIAFTGSIYLDRDPGVLFRPAGRLVKEFRLTPDEFAVELMGHVKSYNGMEIEELGREAGLDGFLHIHPFSSRREAAALLGRAAVLFSLPQDSDLAIPSKIFEYLQFTAWTLAIAEKGSATELALRGSGVDVVSARDEDRILAVLREYFLHFRRGERRARTNSVEHLSRRSQAMRLFDALEASLSGR